MLFRSRSSHTQPQKVQTASATTVGAGDSDASDMVLGALGTRDGGRVQFISTEIIVADRETTGGNRSGDLIEFDRGQCADGDSGAA